MTAATSAASLPDTIVRQQFTLSATQAKFWRSAERYVDLEGGVRSGKTSVAVLKLGQLAWEHPGIHLLACRWTQDATDAQLKPRIRELLSHGFISWHANEEYFEVRSSDATRPSRLYVRGLKASEDSARYSKFAGLTLALIYVDQAEELPEDFYRALQARLSQPGYPQRLLLTPNPPQHDHWLAKEFPEDNSKPDHRYIQTSVYDNRAALGEDYIRALEAAYPTPSQRRFFVEGRRGLGLIGEPVYGSVFRRALHVGPVEMSHELPLLEAWDFGQHHPAVCWSQLTPQGQWHILGEIMGADQFLEDFAPLVIQQRAQWFPHALDIWTCCDPAGADRNSHGLNRNAVEVLRDLGIAVRWVPGSNAPDRRDYAIQSVARHLMRLTPHGPGLRVHPRCTTIIDGLEAGYVWDDKSLQTSTLPNTRRPRKDGYYDHLMNCLEYTQLNFGSAAPTQRETQRELSRIARSLQRDHDPYDRQRSLRVVTRRGGY